MRCSLVFILVMEMVIVLVVGLILQDHGHVGCEALRTRGIVRVDFRYRAILIQLVFLERKGRWRGSENMSTYQRSFLWVDFFLCLPRCEVGNSQSSTTGVHTEYEHSSMIIGQHKQRKRQAV